VYDFFPPAVPKPQARRLLSISEPNVMLYFGYIRAYKGLRYLLEAMPRILKRMRVRLLVCGEFYEEREELFALAERAGLREAVTFHDRFIANEEVAAFFCASDVVVLPYVSATQSGIVQVAYHYDKPVIVTSVGGLPEAVPDGRTGFIVPPRDPEAVAQAVLRYYREKREPAFSRNIRVEKKKYSWDRMAQAVENLAA
jgi:glycosyltransferase involved in cell wall biosynthesis